MWVLLAAALYSELRSWLQTEAAFQNLCLKILQLFTCYNQKAPWVASDLTTLGCEDFVFEKTYVVNGRLSVHSDCKAPNM